VPTDLTQWIASLDAAELERVAVLRPDVVLGAPVRDVADLAERLAHPASVASVLRELPLPAVQVLEVLQAMGAGASIDGAAALLDAGPRGPQEHRDAVAASIGHLVDCALVWPDGTGRLRVNPGLLAVVDRPLGLGWPAALLVPETSATELQKIARRWGLNVPQRKAELVEAVLAALGDAASVRRLVGGAPEPVAAVLLEQAQDAARRWTQPDEPADDDAVPHDLRDPAAFGRHRVAATWAIENGLAFGFRYDVHSARVPSEVLLALVDPAARVRFDPVPPTVPTAPVASAQVTAAASGAVTELLGTVMATLEHLARTPATALKAGGVGAREIARLAKTVGAAPADVRFALELALHADLLAAAGPGRLGVGEPFADWRRLTPARRVADLVQAWAGMRYAPTVDRAPDGTSVPALSRVDDGDAAVTARAAVLGHLLDLPADVGVASPEAVAEAVLWQVPVALGAAAEVLPAALAEAERLGLAALGRLTAVGEAFFSGGTVDALAEALGPMLPEVQARAVVGSDLTVVVMGTPAPDVVDLLDAVAQREARGQASTWRLTPASVRAALDAGYREEDVLAALRRLAGGELPQALEYLVRDVGRRHGHVQVRPAAAVVVGEDPALLAEIAAQRGLRRLGLHAVAPTVLVAAVPPAEVLTALRGAGYLPVETAADGAPVVAVRRLPLARGDGADGDAGSASAVGTPPGGSRRGRADAAADRGGAAAAVPLTDPDAALARWIAESAGGGATPVPGPAPVLGRPVRESPAELAARLVRGEAPPRQEAEAVLAAEIAREARRLSGTEIDQLAHAVVHGLPVRIRYRSRSGGESVRVVSGLEIRFGAVFGWCHLRQDTRMFSLERVLGVIAEPG
jgi:hypothetical protein